MYTEKRLLLLPWMLLFACSNGPLTSQDADAQSDKGPQLTVITEVEPNDTKQQATVLQLNQIGQGTINVSSAGKDKKAKADRDYWQFEVKQEKANVRITLSGLAALDIAFKLYKQSDLSDPLVVANSNRDEKINPKTKRGEIIPSVVLPQGTYILYVYEYRRRSSEPIINEPLQTYQLTLIQQPLLKDTEIEVNDRRVDCSELTVGKAVTGYLATVGDEDWYRLKFPALPGPFSMAAKLISPSNMRPSLIIKNKIEAVLKMVSAIENGQEVVLTNFVVEDPTVELFLVVSGHWDYNTSEEYQLVTELSEVSGEVERETNDRYVEATPITATSRIRGFIDQGKRLDKKPWRQKDYDWYKFDFGQPTAFSAVLSGLADVDLQIEVYQQPDQPPLFVVDENEKKEGEYVPHLWMQTGYLKIMGSGTQYNPQQPYELVMKTYPDQELIEIEPNATKETATALVLGQTREGWLHPKKDVDTYKITIERSKDYHITISGIPVVQLALTIQDENGQVVHEDVRKLDKEPVSITKRLDTGVYYLMVHDRTKKKSNPLNPYKIQVQ